MLICFHVLSFREYLGLTESKTPLKLVLGSMRSVALSISSHNRLNKTSIDKVLICFHVLGFREYLGLTESKTPLKLVLGSVRSVALSISSHNRLNKTESAVFDLVGSLYFGKIRFSRLFRGRNICRCFCVELVKLLHVHRYSVDMLSCSDPSGILQWIMTESRIPQ